MVRKTLASQSARAVGNPPKLAELGPVRQHRLPLFLKTYSGTGFSPHSCSLTLDVHAFFLMAPYS